MKDCICWIIIGLILFGSYGIGGVVAKREVMKNCTSPTKYQSKKIEDIVSSFECIAGKKVDLEFYVENEEDNVLGRIYPMMDIVLIDQKLFKKEVELRVVVYHEILHSFKVDHIEGDYIMNSCQMDIVDYLRPSVVDYYLETNLPVYFKWEYKKT